MMKMKNLARALLELYWRHRIGVAIGLGCVAANVMMAWFVWPHEAAILSIATAGALLAFTLMSPPFAKAMVERDVLKKIWAGQVKTDKELKAGLQRELHQMLDDIVADMKRRGDLPESIEITISADEIRPEPPPGRLH
jgi:hypothetical protein